MGTEWVLSGYCNVVQRGPQHLNCFFSPGAVLYCTWFGAPCLEVDATFVQAFLQALRRMVRLTSSAVTCQRTFRSVWYVETKVVLESSCQNRFGVGLESITAQGPEASRRPQRHTCTYICNFHAKWEVSGLPRPLYSGRGN